MTDKEILKPGDVVTLKGGGFSMTIGWVSGNPGESVATCFWTVNSGEVRSIPIPVAALKLHRA